MISKIMCVIGIPSKEDISAMKVDLKANLSLKKKPIGIESKIKKIHSDCPK